MNKHQKKVCYVLSYRAPFYVRTTALINAIKQIPHVELYEARNTHKGIFRYFETLIRFIKVRYLSNPETYVIGFRGHELYWLLRLFAPRKRFVFDELMSPYDSLVNEKRVINNKSLLAKIIFFIERGILRNANLVITDTAQHASFLTSLYSLPVKKVKVVPVGTDENLFKDFSAISHPTDNEFRVLYYATFLPLHGIDTLVRAAALIKEAPIRVTIIGGKRLTNAVRSMKKLIQDLNINNIEHISWVDFNELPNVIKRADLCLGGPFGGTPQSLRVITGKTFQFLSMEKPVLIGDIPGNTLFIHQENCLIVKQNDPEDLAEKILWAFNNQVLLKSIARSGKILFDHNFSVTRISEIIMEEEIL